MKEKTMRKRKIFNCIICILGGIMSLNFFSVLLLGLTKEWIPTTEILKILNNNNAMQSVITVELFRVIGYACILWGIFSLIRQSCDVIKHIRESRNKELKEQCLNK